MLGALNSGPNTPSGLGASKGKSPYANANPLGGLGSAPSGGPGGLSPSGFANPNRPPSNQRLNRMQQVQAQAPVNMGGESDALSDLLGGGGGSANAKPASGGPGGGIGAGALPKRMPPGGMPGALGGGGGGFQTGPGPVKTPP